MDTDTQQSSPARSKPDRVRPPKLRMSCDACSNTKTKCDQTRPSCLRCQKVGLDCNYSVSQRKGKPAAASRGRPASVHGRHGLRCKKDAKATPETPSPGEQDSYRAALEPAFLLDPDTSMMDLSFAMYEDTTPDMWQDYTPHLNDFTTCDQTSYDVLSFDGDFPDLLNMRSQHVPSLVERPLNRGPSRGLGSGDATRSPAPSRYDCTRLASSTLDSLSAHFPSCSASTVQDSRSVTFDQILIINEAAIENVHQLLSCPCSLSQQSTLMLSLIIDKILTLYQANTRTEQSVGIMSPGSDVLGEKLVRDTPITIGAYKMDARDEQWMRMHILSNELRKAQALVERYADRYGGLGCQDPEDKSIYVALTNLLRRRLKEVIGDIAIALRNSQPGCKQP